MAAPKALPVVPRDVFNPDPIIRRPQRDIDKLSPRHFPRPPRRMQNFSMDLSERERNGPRAFHATLKRIVAGNRATVARASIIFCRRSRSIVRVQIECPITRCLLSAHPPLIYRQSLAKAAEPSCVFGYSLISPSFGGARSLFSFCSKLGENSRYEALGIAPTVSFRCERIVAQSEMALCARDKQTSDFCTKRKYISHAVCCKRDSSGRATKRERIAPLIQRADGL